MVVAGLLQVEGDKEVVDNHLMEEDMVVVDNHLMEEDMEVVGNHLEDKAATEVNLNLVEEEVAHLQNVVMTEEVTATKAVTNMNSKCSMNHLKILIIIKNTFNLKLFIPVINCLL